MLARWLMEQRERPAAREHSEHAVPSTNSAGGGEERTASHEARGRAAHIASDNFFADQASSSPEFRTRS